MIDSIISSTILRGGSSGLNTEAQAPSSSDSQSLNARQTAALLPDLSPVGSTGSGIDPQQQEVNGQKQDSSGDKEELSRVANQANEYFKQVNTDLKFTVNEDTGRVVISVINTATNEVIREIPPDQLQRVAGVLETMQGLLFDVSG
jgi:flagellar protein FlaG